MGQPISMTLALVRYSKSRSGFVFCLLVPEFPGRRGYHLRPPTHEKTCSYRGVRLASHKNKLKHSVDLLIVWCISKTNGLSNHICRFGRKAFRPGTNFGQILKKKPSSKIAQL